MKNEKKQTGRVHSVWVLAGGYLLYLAAQLFFNVFKGTSDSPAIGVTGGVVFTAIGAFLLWREWKAYRFALEHKDDPSTWSDDPETEEEDEG